MKLIEMNIIKQRYFNTIIKSVTTHCHKNIIKHVDILQGNIFSDLCRIRQDTIWFL